MDYESSFYLWVLSPSTGEVKLSNAHDDHPLDVPDHSSMASEINEPNLIHGYAGRVENGWRISDLDGRPITDPFVKRQVAKALGGGETTSNPVPKDFDYDRMQYGRPMSTVQTDGSELS